jgi:hypothetical protein
LRADRSYANAADLLTIASRRYDAVAEIWDAADLMDLRVLPGSEKHCGGVRVRAEWRRGVGRQARQSGGIIVLFYNRLLETCILKRVQVNCTDLARLRMASRTIGRLRCFDSPEARRSLVRWPLVSRTRLDLAPYVSGLRTLAEEHSQATPRASTMCGRGRKKDSGCVSVRLRSALSCTRRSRCRLKLVARYSGT